MQNFENKKSKNTIDDIINKEEKIKNDDTYIEKLTDKLSEKINKSNGNLLNIYNSDKKICF